MLCYSQLSRYLSHTSPWWKDDIMQPWWLVMLLVYLQLHLYSSPAARSVHLTKTFTCYLSPLVPCVCTLSNLIHSDAYLCFLPGFLCPAQCEAATAFRDRQVYCSETNVSYDPAPPSFVPWEFHWLIWRSCDPAGRTIHHTHSKLTWPQQ